MTESGQIEMLHALASREAIKDCLMRYSRAIDRLDRALLETVYWPDATENHGGSFSGGAAEFIDWVIPSLAAMEQTSHQLGNILIDLRGNDAKTETYVEAYHRMPREDGKPYDLVVGGRYVDWMQRRGDEWRIFERTVICDWMREYPDSADWSRPLMGIQFRTNRLGSDPSYALLEWR